MSFEFLDHPADVWVRTRGESLEQAFEQAAYALAKTMWADSEFELIDKKDINISGMDLPETLVSFLSEILYLFDAKGFAFGKITVETLKQKNGNWYLCGHAIGETFTLPKHHPGTEVKAITYSYLKIEKLDENYVVEVIFDI